MNQTLTKMAVVQIKKRMRGEWGVGRCVSVCECVCMRQRERERERENKRASGRMVLCCSGVRKSSPPRRIFKSLMPFKWCHHILLFLSFPSCPPSHPISLNIVPLFKLFPSTPPRHHLPPPPVSHLTTGRGRWASTGVTWRIRIMAEQDAKHLVFLWLMCFFPLQFYFLKVISY